MKTKAPPKLQKKSDSKTINKPDSKKVSTLHPVLKNSLGYCLSKAAMRSRQLMDSALAPHGLVTYQYALLARLMYDGPMSQIDLGTEMGIDKASMVRFLDGLEAADLVKRVAGENDRRIKMVGITTKGRKMAQVAMKIRDEVQKDFLSPLSEIEKKAYALIIPKLIS